MKLLTNHCWCSDSNWGGLYDCRHILTIDRIPEGKSYHDAPEEDWVNLTEEFTYFNQEEYDRLRASENLKDIKDITLRCSSTRTASTLKPEVIQWLNENVKDRDGKEQPKGWCIGSPKYLSGNTVLSLNIFFHRRMDALAFVKRWSTYKKLTFDFNYFRDTRKHLNLKTGKYEADD